MQSRNSTTEPSVHIALKWRQTNKPIHNIISRLKKENVHLLSCSRSDTTLWLHPLSVKETIGEESKWELPIDFVYCFEKKFLKQNSTPQQLYSHLHHISEIILIRWKRYTGHKSFLFCLSISNLRRKSNLWNDNLKLLQINSLFLLWAIFRFSPTDGTSILFLSYFSTSSINQFDIYLLKESKMVWFGQVCFTSYQSLMRYQRFHIINFHWIICFWLFQSNTHN